MKKFRMLLMEKVNHYNVIFIYDFTYKKTKFPSALEYENNE